MSSTFGENSKAGANSKAYVESPYWAKRDERKRAEAEAKRPNNDEKAKTK